MYMHKDFVVNAIVRSLRLWSTDSYSQKTFFNVLSCSLNLHSAQAIILPYACLYYIF